ncbi:hypothetical protein [Metamycoplasma neophronis]|uniref:Uncharacterized protein n=1 Tax=Metamycoplasma neophronis TaxID=872983 RepID=A0ABY2Z0A5_9BACT|nr:hypothetical protein [Metamycoplasma neophronis]TPR53264.1 hypothetical protein FJR74_02875 [Metamycoplasma neophronis]
MDIKKRNILLTVGLLVVGGGAIAGTTFAIQKSANKKNERGSVQNDIKSQVLSTISLIDQAQPSFRYATIKTEFLTNLSDYSISYKNGSVYFYKTNQSISELEAINKILAKERVTINEAITSLKLQYEEYTLKIANIRSEIQTLIDSLNKQTEAQKINKLQNALAVNNINKTDLIDQYITVYNTLKTIYDEEKK